MKLLFVLVSTTALIGCQSNPASPGGTQARADLEARSGSKVSGQVRFTERTDKVLVAAKVSGLKPNSEHGFHVHEKGDCSAPDGASAAGHFNPDGHPHAHSKHEKRHTGDMNNLVADSKGDATVSFEVDKMRLDNGKHGILERAVIIHAEPDDYVSQPTGNAGGRIACGIIRKL